MKKSKLYTGTYIILAILCAFLLGAGIVASVKDNGSVMVVPSIIAFSIYAILQIGCLVLYTFKVTPYKIGFYLEHFGLLVMLVGFLAGYIGGESHFVPMRVGSRYQATLTLQDGELTSLGFYPEITGFTVEKYQSGSDKLYHADFSIYDVSTNRHLGTKALEVNHTIRQNGWKIYLMSYSDGSGELYKLNQAKIEKSYFGSDFDALESELYADLADKEVIFQYYDFVSSSAGGPVLVGKSWLSENVQANCYAHVYFHGGAAIVVVCPQYVTLLYKQDPGEFVVIAGMCMVLSGVVLTCLIRKRKRAEVDEQ